MKIMKRATLVVTLCLLSIQPITYRSLSAIGWKTTLGSIVGAGLLSYWYGTKQAKGEKTVVDTALESIEKRTGNPKQWVAAGKKMLNNAFSSISAQAKNKAKKIATALLITGGLFCTYKLVSSWGTTYQYISPDGKTVVRKVSGPFGSVSKIEISS